MQRVDENIRYRVALIEENVTTKEKSIIASSSFSSDKYLTKEYMIRLRRAISSVLNFETDSHINKLIKEAPGGP